MNTNSILAPARPFCPAELLRVAGHPVLLLATGAAIALSIHAEWNLALASLVILFGALAALFVAERIIPFREIWQPSKGEWKRDSIYFGINGVMSTLITAGVSIAAIALAPGTTGLALVAEVPLAVFTAGFVGYWTHRLGHEVGVLWDLHGVHHTPDKVNAWNNNVIHFLDLTFQNGATLFALLLIGFSPEAVFAVTAFTQVLGFVDHANADFRIGRLNYVIGSPEQHRLHHSLDLSEAGNYSFLPIIDMAFGTFTWRPGREPARVGVTAPEAFPQPSSIVKNALHPLRVWLRGRRSA